MCRQVSGGGLVVHAVSMPCTHPLCLELLPALGVIDRIGEDAIILPQLQLRERGTTSKEIQHAADESALLFAELNTRRGLDIRALDLELADVGGGRHPVLLLDGRRWRSEIASEG